MLTKHLCGSIHITTKCEVGTVKLLFFFADRSKAMLFCGSFLLYMFHIYLCYAVLSVHCSHGSPARKGLVSGLSCACVFLCYVIITYGVPSQVRYLMSPPGGSVLP